MTTLLFGVYLAYIGLGLPHSIFGAALLPAYLTVWLPNRGIAITRITKSLLRTIAGGVFICIRIPPAVPVVPKSFSYA